ncbi:MAG: DUF58 domain-containing protein [Chloroflexi bacterium]|nr:DUF58 domain-containing protein [Chloroflexota bacterium]
MADLLEPEFLKSLQKLYLLIRRAGPGVLPGRHPSPARGRSAEYADYRGYTPGDDLRYIDWNLYARMDRLMLKLFSDERETSLYLVIDSSASMGCSPRKFSSALRTAAVLAYISLAGGDRVSLASIAGKLSGYLPPMRGKAAIKRCLTFLDELRPGGATGLSGSLEEFSGRLHRPGLVIILSDFLSEEEFFTALKRLIYMKNRLFLLQILGEDEISPPPGEDITLSDSETGEKRDLTMSVDIMAAYGNALEAHTGKLSEFCMNTRSGFFRAGTALPLEKIILECYRQAGDISRAVS